MTTRGAGRGAEQQAEQRGGSLVMLKEMEETNAQQNLTGMMSEPVPAAAR